MRRIAVVLLGGLFPITAVLASCGPEASSSAEPDGSVVTYINPVQSCIDARSLVDTLCHREPPDYTKRCQNEFKNAGPECSDEFGIQWACNLAGLQSDAMACPMYFPCWPQANETEHCVKQHGCELNLWRNTGSVSTDGCVCSEWCYEPMKRYTTDCNPNGTTWSCDCYIDPYPGPAPVNLVGTCDPGGPFCDLNVDLSCCNQFFKLPF